MLWRRDTEHGRGQLEEQLGPSQSDFRQAFNSSQEHRFQAMPRREAGHERKSGSQSRCEQFVTGLLHSHSRASSLGPSICRVHGSVNSFLHNSQHTLQPRLHILYHSLVIACCDIKSDYFLACWTFLRKATLIWQQAGSCKRLSTLISSWVMSVLRRRSNASEQQLCLMFWSLFSNKAFLLQFQRLPLLNRAHWAR